MASTFAVGLLGPEEHSAVAGPTDVRHAVVTDLMTAPEPAHCSDEQGFSVVRLTPLPREWTNQMEREFRRLALVEAEGALAPDQAARLEELSRWRDQLIEPRSPEDVLRQLKRDRLMDKISETLREYVEFHEGARNARPTAR